MKKGTKTEINMERQKAIFWVNPDKKDFGVYVEIAKIHNHINISCKKSLKDKISKRSSK